jgi:hypothetical protein
VPNGNVDCKLEPNYGVEATVSIAIIAALAFVAGVLAAGGGLLVFAAWTTRDVREVERRSRYSPTGASRPLG